MICRDDLELRWRLLMRENELSHIISTVIHFYCIFLSYDHCYVPKEI